MAFWLLECTTKLLDDMESPMMVGKKHVYIDLVKVYIKGIIHQLFFLLLFKSHILDNNGA